LYNNDTGELLCRVEPVYGGTHRIDLGRFDEPGYIANPACMFGSAEHGLEAPPLMNGMTIHVEATTNNTFGHHGEMALPQAMVAQGYRPPAAPCGAAAPLTEERDRNNVFGALPAPGRSTDKVQFLGSFDTLGECEQSFLRAGAATTAQSYTYVTDGFADPKWRRQCYRRLDGVYAPRAEAGIVCGRCH